MKSFKFIGMALIAIMMSANFASCGSDEEVLSTPTKPEAGIESPKEYIVSLGWKGEIVDITESPLATRGVKNNDMYGIQVYSRPDIDDYSQNYTQYAYGLFDNTGKMTIKLLEGYKYKFVATMVVDGKNKVYSWENENGLIAFELPFNNNNGYATPLTNKFKYSSVESFYSWSLEKGQAHSTIMNTYVQRPENDRYYGELTDYKPSENGVANIKMKRTSFGVKVVAEELTEGSLNIRIENSISMLIEHPNTEAQELLSFEYCKYAWQDGDVWEDGTPYTYSENIPISFTWTKEDGVEIPLGTRTIEFKRNKLTTITIRISDKGSENDVGVSYDEAGEMDEGGNVVIDAGGSSDNEVNPEI